MSIKRRYLNGILSGALALATTAPALGAQNGTSRAADGGAALVQPLPLGDSLDVLGLADHMAALEASARMREAADRDRGARLVVSIADRRLWWLKGSDTLHTAEVAVGSGEVLAHGDRSWTFVTPVSKRRVLSREADPVWVPPDWHYVEVARDEGLELEQLERGRTVTLLDGRRLTVRGRSVGLLDAGGDFTPLPVGQEIVFDGTLYVPPFGTEHRRIPGELGAYKLDLGDGYLLHGTPHVSSIGTASTHGCLRLHDEDIAFLYENVPLGTPVYIY